MNFKALKPNYNHMKQINNINFSKKINDKAILIQTRRLKEEDRERIWNEIQERLDKQSAASGNEE